MSSRRRFLMAAVGLAAAAAGCGPRNAANTVTIKGSDTMVIMVQRWAEIYMKTHPGTVVQVTGGGSGTGIAALINGGTDICASSRPMKAKEREQVKARRGAEAVETPVALDGIAVYVHESNPIVSLTLADVKRIYRGAVKNWSEFGFRGPIVVYSRENNSGTYEYFKEHVLEGEDFAASVQTLPGTAAVVNAVSKDVRAIGYGGIAYSKGVRAVPIAARKGARAVEPSVATVTSGRYPISRKLFFYTAGAPSGGAAPFVAWVLSAEGQAICRQVGYFPLK